MSWLGPHQSTYCTPLNCSYISILLMQVVQLLYSQTLSLMPKIGHSKKMEVGLKFQTQPWQKYRRVILILLVLLVSLGSIEQRTKFNLVFVVIRNNIYQICVSPSTFKEYIGPCIFYSINTHVPLGCKHFSKTNNKISKQTSFVTGLSKINGSRTKFVLEQ